MQVSRFESFTLIAAVIGSAILNSGSPMAGGSWAAVGNLVILLALFTLDGTEARSGAQSIAFGGASGFCLLTPVFFLAKTILGVTPPGENSPWFIFGAWIVATIIMFGLDRFRMSAKDNVSLAGAGLAGASPVPLGSISEPTRYRPAPIRVEALPDTPAQNMPMQNIPIQSIPVQSSPAAASFSAPVAQAVAPAPDVLAIPPGREALIYLNLVGEGLNVLRTVRAENLGHDYYRIADIMPENEQWEFTPGQVVKCRKKSLSNGKHMVAYEEAPRAQ